MHQVLPAFLTSALLATALAGQQIRFVDATATGANDGTSWVDAFVNLQPALQSVPVGTELWVRGGTYLASAVGNQAASFVLRSGVALYGGFAGTETARWQRDVAANPSVLSGDLASDDVQGSGVDWYFGIGGWGENTYQIVTGNGVDATAVLDGFLVTNAWAYPSSGAGLYIASGSPRIANCTFRHCLSSWGGAIYVDTGTPTVSDCIFDENRSADGRGGAIACYGTTQATVRDCTFTANSSRSVFECLGGAIYIDFGTTALVEGCRFDGNRAGSTSITGLLRGSGGGICNLGAGSIFRDCTFTANVTNMGGGIFAYAAMTVTGCVFNNNDVASYPMGTVSQGGIGGGLVALGFSTSPIAVSLTNCTFVNGHASDDGGGAYLANTTGQVTGCVFWNNSDSLGQIGRSQCTGKKPRYSCVMNLLVAPPGEDPIDPLDYPGSFDTPPQFVDADGANNLLGDEDDDMRLLATSPCVDRADPAATSLLRDVHGVPRWLDGDLNGVMRIDCGAHEFTLAQLAATVAPTSATTANVSFALSGTPGLPALLALGQAGPGFVLAPFGGVFLDLSTPIVLIAMPPAPGTYVVAANRTGFAWTAQAVAFGVGGGTTSNPVTFGL